MLLPLVIDAADKRYSHEGEEEKLLNELPNQYFGL
jgi:hypothetical protein